jgi:hypothetical protein
MTARRGVNRVSLFPSRAAPTHGSMCPNSRPVHPSCCWRGWLSTRERNGAGGVAAFQKSLGSGCVESQPKQDCNADEEVLVEDECGIVLLHVRTDKNNSLARSNIDARFRRSVVEEYNACPNIVGMSTYHHTGGCRGSSGRFIGSTLVTK